MLHYGYKSVGHTTNQKEIYTMNIRTAERFLLSLILALIIVLIALMVSDPYSVLAQGAGVIRPDGCRTYNVNAIFGGVDNMDALTCGIGTQTPSQTPYVPNKGIVAETDKPEQPIDDGGVILDKPEDKPEEPKDDSCTHGNPGNTRCVGNAGEDPNGRGTMPQDNAGGNGNGEHGNQGQGGNHSAFGVSALLIGFLKLRKVNDAYFFPVLRIGSHVSIDIWIRADDWRFFLISPSSANDEAYYCLNMYLGILNISYTWLA